MKLLILHKGFNYSQDGPGNRLVYHLQGCNFRCPWCSNPESIALNGSIVTKGSINFSCPNGAVLENVLDRKICSSCSDKCCIRDYSSGIRLSCHEVETDEVLDEIMRSAAMFFDGGGVTFTGGEATLQIDALTELLTRLHENGVNTALETNGSSKLLTKISPYIDHLIIDCKHYSCKTHYDFFRAGNEIVIENLYRLSHSRRQLSIRIPLINGFNASFDDAIGFAELFKKVCTDICDYELLRYHEYGKDKWKSCGMEYRMSDAFISEETYKMFTKCFTESGLNIIRT